MATKVRGSIVASPDMVASTKRLEETCCWPDSATLSTFVHRLYHGVPDVDARQADGTCPSCGAKLAVPLRTAPKRQIYHWGIVGSGMQ